MSRVSHAARLERLKRQLRGEPVVKVYPAPWLLEMILGRPPTAEELKLTAEELAKYKRRGEAPR
jgi:hypothetical protein